MHKYCFFKKKILSNLIIFFIFSAFFAGCAGTGKENNELFFDKWEAIADKSEGYSPAPSESADEQKGIIIEDSFKEKFASDKVVAEQVPEKLFPTEKITLEMHDVEIAVLLKTLARSVNQNIIISESVKGNAYISIKDTSWDKVFKGVLNANGLSYEWEGDIIRIITTDDINQSLSLMEAEQKMAAGKQEHELKMEILRSKVRMSEPLQTWIYHVKYADTEILRDNMEEFLKSSHAGATESLKDSGEQGKGDSQSRGTIFVDTHTNSLVIQAVQSELARMRAIVLEIDKPTLQVLIQAHIVEANSKTALELGIEWGGLYKSSSNGGQNWITPGANSTGIQDATIGEQLDPSAGMAANFPADLSGGKGLTLGFISQKVGQHILTAQLSALEEDGKLNILSSPSITTLDNQKAIIESGKDIPYQTVEDDDVQIEWKKAVIRLEVTPYIIDNKTLKLGINTKKDEVDFSDRIWGNPVIITKNAETNVVLFDGQTTVIAGLSKENVSDGEAGVPFLKDIPFIGYLFKSKSKRNEKEELLIFITPYILKEKL